MRVGRGAWGVGCGVCVCVCVCVCERERESLRVRMHVRVWKGTSGTELRQTTPARQRLALPGPAGERGGEKKRERTSGWAALLGRW